MAKKTTAIAKRNPSSMARRRKNPKLNLRNMLIGAGIGATINAALKYWGTPPSMSVYGPEPAVEEAYAKGGYPSDAPQGIAIGGTRNSRAFYALLPGALLGGIAGMAYTGATK